MEPDCVSCARPMPVPPALGGMWSSTHSLSPQGCGKSEKMMGPSAGPRSWQRGCEALAAFSPKAWLLRRMCNSPRAQKFLEGLFNLEIAFGRDNEEKQIHFLPKLSKAVSASLTETLLCLST